MPTDLLNSLAATGVGGVLGAIVIWAAWKVYQREITRNDRLERELRSMRTKMEEKVIPALLEASRQSKELANFLNHFNKSKGN